MTRSLGTKKAASMAIEAIPAPSCGVGAGRRREDRGQSALVDGSCPPTWPGRVEAARRGGRLIRVPTHEVGGFEDERRRLS